jgi:hypothetical protein
MLWGKSRSTARYHMVYPDLPQPDHIKVTLNDNRLTPLTNRSHRERQPVQSLMLPIEGTFNRIEIFWPISTIGEEGWHNPTPKSDNLISLRDYRKNNPPPKRGDKVARFVFLEETNRQARFIRDIRLSQPGDEPLAPNGSKSDPKRPHRLPRDRPRIQIRPNLIGRPLKTPLKIPLSFRKRPFKLPLSPTILHPRC